MEVALLPSKILNARRMSMVSSRKSAASKSDSSLKSSWKSGVMNLSFLREDQDCESPDSGVDDVFSPITSPTSNDHSEIYHKAFSRRKLRMEDECTMKSPRSLSSTSGGLDSDAAARRFVKKVALSRLESTGITCCSSPDDSASYQPSALGVEPQIMTSRQYVVSMVEMSSRQLGRVERGSFVIKDNDSWRNASRELCPIAEERPQR